MGSDITIDALLSRLEKKQDGDVARTTLQGRALSRSEENLHLAVAMGVVAIPLSNIEKVIPVPASQPDIVRVVVKNPTAVQTLLQATRTTAPAGRVRGEPIGTGPGPGVSTCTWYDTPTITGDEADACDDEDAECQADDLMQ